MLTGDIYIRNKSKFYTDPTSYDKVNDFTLTTRCFRLIGAIPGIHWFYICIDLGTKKREKELD